MDVEKRSLENLSPVSDNSISDGVLRDVEKEELGNHGEGNTDLGAEQGEDLERSKSTKSIAETLSLPREAAFVFVICMAQFMTRSLLPSSCQPSQY
jgi:hypothetical protein